MFNRPSIWSDILTIIVLIYTAFKVGLVMPAEFGLFSGPFLTLLVVYIAAMRLSCIGQLIRNTISLGSIFGFIWVIAMDSPELLMYFVLLTALMFICFAIVRRFPGIQ